MKNKFTVVLLLLSMISAASVAQYNNRYKYIDRKDDEIGSYLKIGTQIPVQHSIVYDHRITPAFSINAGLGVIAAPYPNMILGSIENKGLISSNDRQIIDRIYQSGLTYQLGANFHFNKNYLRLFGQLARLNGDMAITDLANLYFKTNFPLINFLNPIDIKTNVPMVGMLYGRRFVVGENSEIHLEASVSKSVGHNSNYKTGTFLDNIELVNDIVYNELDNDLDQFFHKYGWVPSLNVYYVFKF